MGLSHILPISISLGVTYKKPRIVSVAHLLVGATAPQGLQAELDQRITGIRGSYQFISIHIISPCEIIQTYNCIITNCIYVQHIYIVQTSLKHKENKHVRTDDGPNICAQFLHEANILRPVTKQWNLLKE